MSKRSRSGHPAGSRDQSESVVGLRIIGGSLRGRKLLYSGELRTRPMKDRVREAVFNLLGVQVAGSHAIDLFAGTGALGLEAISRGAARATFIERHLPTARLIEQNIGALGLGHQAAVVFGDALGWSAAYRSPDGTSLTVFCSPPYDFYVERRQQMLELVARWGAISPVGSQIVVEADERFDFGGLIEPDKWDVRSYPPAVVGIYERTA
jgi:16S rRNA (guanine966-N2)-methyltransferase